MAFEAKNILSLGAWCQATYQVRRMFGSSAPSPYDWLVTPFDALISSLEDEGRKFGQAVFVRDNVYPTCHHYGALYHHEFKPSSDRLVITEEALSACRSKLIHKYNRFADLMSVGGNLLVRMGGHAKPAVAWPYITDPVPLKSAEINNLTSVLDRKFGNHDYRILIVNLEGRVVVDLDEPVDDRVIFRTIPFATETSRWEGADEAWNEIFDGLPISIAMRRREDRAA